MFQCTYTENKWNNFIPAMSTKSSMLLHIYQIKCDVVVVVVVVVTCSTHFKSYFKFHKLENIQFLYTINSYSWCCVCLECYEQYISLHLQGWRFVTTSATVNISFLCFCDQPYDDHHYLPKDVAGLVHEIKLFLTEYTAFLVTMWTQQRCNLRQHVGLTCHITGT